VDLVLFLAQDVGHLLLSRLALQSRQTEPGQVEVGEPSPGQKDSSGGKRQQHDHSQQQCEIALHSRFLLNIK
jgi:hypothetical protein